MKDKTSLDRLGDFRDWFVLAKHLQEDSDAAGIGRTCPDQAGREKSGRTILERFDEVVINEALRSASRRLFADGHYARAVEEAFKCMNNEVKRKSEVLDSDGSGLMKRAFSANSPILRLNDLRTDSDRDEQLGYMEIYSGVMTGIRNPRAHEHMLEDDPDVAIELLTVANHLMRRLDSAKQTDNQSKGSNGS